MTGRPHWKQRRSTSASQAGVTSRAEWRGLVSLAQQCVEDVKAGAVGNDAEFRRLSLARKSRGAKTTVLAREAGALVEDVAKAFALTAGAFARCASGDASGLAPSLLSLGEALDDQLHRLAERDFHQAHRGRPEVYG